MEDSADNTPATGCLIAFVAAATAFGVWLRTARPGLRGAFEGQRDWTLLYLDLPCMLIGVPAITLLVWASTRRALGARVARTPRTLLSAVTATAALLLLAWLCLIWLDTRLDWLSPE
ncbi:hypothetical protein [Streptomyces sp. CBMA29]|uniref:hypothetical protein n=1 Tax=Streptomyces sp. CBMA29 TaxID=1896314 RepID=UPI001661F442|nr:hypothetical protein [Streptomyces sp. CBMA29]MBD0737164.1 hypothetical protein [Streptomyces sp. CBMA29]